VRRDQWQALEGLGGINLLRGKLDKAINYYKKAIGICAVSGSDDHEQDRLVTKLSSVIQRKVTDLQRQRHAATPISPSQGAHCPYSGLAPSYSTVMEALPPPHQYQAAHYPSSPQQPVYPTAQHLQLQVS